MRLLHLCRLLHSDLYGSARLHLCSTTYSSSLLRSCTATRPSALLPTRLQNCLHFCEILHYCLRFCTTICDSAPLPNPAALPALLRHYLHFCKTTCSPAPLPMQRTQDVTELIQRHFNRQQTHDFVINLFAPKLQFWCKEYEVFL